MNAELIAVGSEMLLHGHRDTNGDWLVEQFLRNGVLVGARVVVDDDARRIGSCVATALRRAELVLVVGGLGPTEDDRTREGIALGLDLPLQRDETQVQRLRALFASRSREFRPLQARQADRPCGAEWIDNPIGTAPGLALSSAGARLVALPGVPAEMKAMFRAAVLPALKGRPGERLACRTLRVAGRTESSVDEQLADLYARPGVTVSVLCGGEGIELRLAAEGREEGEAARLADEIEEQMAERLGQDLYGRGDQTLALACGTLLVRLGATVATAESCTAGLLAAAFTDVPGSSAWFRGGLVVYSDDLKARLGGVAPASISQHGAVSEAVARELATAARERCGAEYGIGITGIAGPGGGTACKPAGLVHLALAGPGGIEHWRTQQFGDRDLVRRRTVVAAMDRLRRVLLARLAVERPG